MKLGDFAFPVLNLASLSDGFRRCLLVILPVRATLTQAACAHGCLQHYDPNVITKVTNYRKPVCSSELQCGIVDVEMLDH